MPHVPGCGCPAPTTGPCPLDDSPPPAPTTRDLMRAALESDDGTDQQTSAGRPVALNDDNALKAIIGAALGGPVNQQ